jgi:hypothetical protein
VTFYVIIRVTQWVKKRVVCGSTHKESHRQNHIRSRILYSTLSHFIKISLTLSPTLFPSLSPVLLSLPLSICPLTDPLTQTLSLPLIPTPDFFFSLFLLHYYFSIYSYDFNGICEASADWAHPMNFPFGRKWV